jgi:ring-1,2-phenylacetyl-CoA epoxidase subunit PaaE
LHSNATFEAMATPKFHSLKVKNITQETADCVTVAVSIPTELQQDFAYQPGQYITFKNTSLCNEEIRRSYSICTAPHENELRVAIKKVQNGLFSTHANEALKTGENVEVMTPTGNFILNENIEQNYFGFASGSGITPIISIIKHVLHTNNSSTFTLIYGNKNLASIIFKEELEALKNIYMQSLQVVHILSRERLEVDLNYGRINKEKCVQLFTKLFDVKTIGTSFLCGPEEMIHDVKDFLIENGVATDKIKFELFGTAPKIKVEETLIAEDANIVKRKVSIKVDDRTIEFEIPENGENILDAALKNGADLPYACKGGVCCTCRAKVTQGKVRMDVNYALEQDELDAGFVLTCQAHPITDDVVIDFDVR